MRKVDGFTRRYAAMYNDKTGQSLVLSGRKSAIRPKEMVARHESSSGNDQVCHVNGTIGSRRAENRHIAVRELDRGVPRSLNQQILL